MKLLYTIISLFIANLLFAQKPYFQQDVDYEITVTLNDSLHLLTGSIVINYQNNAPDRLDSIYFHLWGNAFQNRNTAFARQQLRTGSTEFYFANAAELGGYSNLNFTVDGAKAVLTLQKDHPDIAVLRLPKSLESGQKVVIQTPFTLQIPASFSRLGHVGESYQMTQWYPKPAVYDRDGWHPMPNLDIGEYYAEFGNFDVTITLPDNYVVAATGVLQTKSEQAFLQQKAASEISALPGAAQEPFPPSATSFKTIRYTAEQVHDFAWFADKRFQVQKGEVALQSGKKIDTWVFFTRFEQDLWEDALEYVNRSVKFYSDLVGEYPHPQATAVQSALSAGAGMEYPMITVIGEAVSAKDLDLVITHEVGHNWWYGIVANNERDHAWLDEGINSYYEKRYAKQYYDIADQLTNLPNILRKGSTLSFAEAAYLWQARRHLDQAPATTSNDFTTANYYLGAYEKPALALQYLEAYLGKAQFDAAMQQYFKNWQFKHPQPIDFQQFLEQVAGKNLSWLFEGLLYSNAKQDYAITNLVEKEKYQVTVKNRGDLAGPFTLTGLKHDKIVFQQWYEGFFGIQTLDFPVGNYNLIVLDNERVTLDVNRKNNQIRTGGAFRKLEPLNINFLTGLENERQTQAFWSPALAWNNYDKFMPGAAIHNYGIPFKKLQFIAVPFYSFATKSVNGLLDVQYHLYPNSNALQRITLGLTGRAFHFSTNNRFDYDLKYARLVPFINVELNKKPTSNFFQNVQWRSIWLNMQSGQFDREGKFLNTKWDDTFMHELRYMGEQRRVLNPFSLGVILEQQSYNDIGGRQHYLKASLEWKSSFTYAAQKNVDLRLFGGFFLDNTRRRAGGIFPGAFNLVSQGFNEYRFDDAYFGRTDREGLWAQQVSIRDGGLKNVIGSGFNLGRSNHYILAVNLKADLPIRFPLHLPLKPYFDIGYFDNAQPTGTDDTLQDQLLWSGGVALEFINEAFAIYFPLFNSRNIQDRYQERGNYLQRISFTLDLGRLNPLRWVERLVF
jgi:hypothetical protein